MKAVSRKGIVFAALIDDTQVPMGGRLLIGNDTIHFPDLKGSRVTFIIQANGKWERLVMGFFHDQSRNGSFSLNSLLPMPCASYQ